VLEVWDEVLTLPVVGVVDTERSAQMTERLLTEVVQSRCRFVIIDLTGVQLIDSSTADRIIKLSRSVQLLGAECILTGIQPAVAQTLVELGVEFSNVNTQRNLKRALQLCMRTLQATAPSGGRS
jgi:rsbT co-antagonist protein RsbR